MKHNRLSFIPTAVLTAGALIASIAVKAEDLPQIKTRKQLSVTRGFPGTSLPVLQRAGALDQNQVSASLIEKFRPGSEQQSTQIGGTLRTTGEQWSLEVSSDGFGAEYHDLAVQARAHALGRPVSQQMPAAELEQKGRAFIASQLASQIALGANEQLIALRADYRTEGGEDLNTGQTTSAVVASRIVFGRTIGGVPVVGNGSKVIITFTNDGALESFRYDWPKYEAGAPQNVVGPAEVLTRLQKVMAVRNGANPGNPAVAVPGRGPNAYPVALSSNTQLQSLDCGYYDSGSKGRGIHSVQPGCTYLTVSQDTNGMRQGFAGAVPAGTTFAVNAAWMETRILGQQ